MTHGIYIPWRSENPGPWARAWLEATGYRDATRYNADAVPDYFCTHLILKGKLRFKTGNGVDVVVGPDDLFSMWPNISWRIAPEPPCKGEDVYMDWVRVRGPLAREFSHLLGTTEDCPWGRAARPKRARTLMQRLQVLTKEFPPQANLTAQSILYQLAAACSNEEHETTDGRTPAERIREAMDQHVGSGMNIEDFARAFRISRSNLFLIFKQAFGKSPIQILTAIRLRRAMRLLEDTDLSVSEVAYAAGYKDPLYFSRQFRKQTGKAPKQMRRSHKKKVSSVPGT